MQTVAPKGSDPGSRQAIESCSPCSLDVPERLRAKSIDLAEGALSRQSGTWVFLKSS